MADAFVSQIYSLYLGLSKKVMVPDFPFLISETPLIFIFEFPEIVPETKLASSLKAGNVINEQKGY